MKRRFGRKNGSAAEQNGRQNPWPRRLSLLVVVAAVFAVAGGVGAIVRHQNASKLVSPVGAAGPRGLAVGLSGAPSVTLVLFEDMRSPASRAFQTTYWPALSKLADAGLVRIQYREVATEDKQAGGSGSLHAANALACAQDAKNFSAYRKVLLADQPALTDDAFASNSHLIKLARKVKGLDTDVFRGCVRKGQYDVWVRTSTADFAQQQPGATAPVLQMAKTSDNGTAVPVADVVTTTLYPATGHRLTPTELVDTVTAVALDRPTPTPSATKKAKVKAKAKKKHTAVRATASPSATR